MTPTETRERTGPLLIRDFFDAPTVEGILSELRAARGGPASVYGGAEGGSVDERVRRATRLLPSREKVEFVARRLLERKPEVERYFDVSLGECEEPAFVRYDVGDFFVAHQDGNTGMLMLESDRARRVSVVIFLNRQTESPEPGAYCGGSLVIYEPGRGPGCGEEGSARLGGGAGTFVAFRAETTHEVTPVEHGERYTIVSWYR